MLKYTKLWLENKNEKKKAKSLKKKNLQRKTKSFQHSHRSNHQSLFAVKTHKQNKETQKKKDQIGVNNQLS